MEYRVSNIRLYKDKKGKIDVVWTDRGNYPAVAIEVETSLKPKSMMKLASLSSEYKIYAYYGEQSESWIKEFQNAYDLEKNIIFISIPLTLGKNKDYGVTKEHYR